MRKKVIQEFNFYNILKFIFSSKLYFIEFVKKIFIRFFDTKSFFFQKKNQILLKKNSINLISFLRDLDKNLAKESIIEMNKIETKGKKILKKIPFDLGSSGKSVLLYFFTRYFKPKIIVETGVAAGFSSYAFLLAIKKNKKGILYSSDLPYFRIKNPEKYIGIVVPQELKLKWKLFTEGDSANIKKIKKYFSKIDLVHYDSDKSYYGRNFFFNSIKKKINRNTVIIMDDLHNNIFFFDYIKKNKIKNFKVLKHKNDYVGIVYPYNIKKL